MQKRIAKDSKCATKTKSHFGADYRADYIDTANGWWVLYLRQATGNVRSHFFVKVFDMEFEQIRTPMDGLMRDLAYRNGYYDAHRWAVLA